MIPETGNYQELKRAVLQALPDIKVLAYRVTTVDRRVHRSYQEAGEAIRALRDQSILSGEPCIIEPVWG